MWEKLALGDVTQAASGPKSFCILSIKGMKLDFFFMRKKQQQQQARDTNKASFDIFQVTNRHAAILNFY